MTQPQTMPSPGAPVRYTYHPAAPVAVAAPAPTAPTAQQPQNLYGVHQLFADYVAMYERGMQVSGMSEHPWRRPRFFHLVQMFRLTAGLQGCTAEAGCYRGLSSYLICHEQRRADPAFNGSTHVIVDSFEGLSVPTETDGERSRTVQARGAFADTSVEHVRRTLSEFPQVTFHKGWIPPVFKQVVERRYRFVHIDVDLYEPTLAGLRYFMPRMVPGGVLVVDDYGPWPGGEWPGCAVAVHEFARESGAPFCSLDTGNAVFIKR